jgi:hypothetical protein
MKTGDSIPKLFEPDAPSPPVRIPVFRFGFMSAMTGFAREEIRVEGHRGRGGLAGLPPMTEDSGQKYTDPCVLMRLHF